jgi:arabinofuranosyltransferase
MSEESEKEPTEPAAPPAEKDAGLRLAQSVRLAVGLVMPLIWLARGMWRLREHTIDDAYISYRYAKNLARGLGLVFNEGERIEGYTNFLFTCLLAAAYKLGADPDHTAKIIGALSAFGSIGCMYAISARLWPVGVTPVVSTWFLATSTVTAGYAVFGLETSFFVFLLLLATWLFLRERARPEAFPWSGAALALAGLTRPEAPMFAGLLMFFLAGTPPPEGVKRSRLTVLLSPVRDLFERRNLLRAALFVVPVAAHLVFRRLYYGAWVPNTFSAKTGNLEQQFYSGIDYMRRYGMHAGPILALALPGVVLAIVQRRRELGAFIAIGLAVPGYILLVGGDWMPLFRFMATFEPFCFLLADRFLRELVDKRPRWVALLAAAAAVVGAWTRGRTFSDGTRLIDGERIFWTSSAGGVARWFADNGERGTIAVADMGYIGYATDYPILDLLGLIDPVISKLPGGYTRKTGAGYTDRVFEVQPRYFVFVGSANDCVKLPFPSQSRLKNDARFRGRYDVAGKVRHSAGGYWCIFAARDAKTAP